MIIAFFILVLAIPAGFILAWMTKDELTDGREWFKLLMVVLFVLGIVFLLVENYAINLTFYFMFIVAGISYWKSFDKK